MQNSDLFMPAAEETSRRLYVYNGGFLTQGRVRRILELSGFDIRIGKPSEGDLVGVWGQSPTSPRGEKVAQWANSPILRVEDAFLRSVLPGREGEPPIGLNIDQNGVHFDASTISDLERLLIEEPLDDTAVLQRARDGIKRMQRLHLSKYNCFDTTIEPPEPGYVLIIDQTRGDASVKASRADSNTFREMLFLAREEHPRARILIRTHPETASGNRPGYYSEGDGDANVSLIDANISPWTLLEGAIAVYTVSSQMGFDAILAGHKPIVFGQPFYMGWGLTEDRTPLDRRQRRLTRAQLFAAAMILYPRWYDPYRDRLCSFEEALDTLEALTRAWREDHSGWQASGMRLWKRGPIQAFFGQHRKVKFSEKAPATNPRRHMVWASAAQVHQDAVKVEDGFIRSRGLGAELTPPLSLVVDDLGIYYDPARASRLEALIAESETLPDDARHRAERLLQRIIKSGVTKYNLQALNAQGEVSSGRKILVPGQVEDDASIRLGASSINTNLALLKATRAANPAAILLYKPHPDVEAGLRKGAIKNSEGLADIILSDTDPISAIDAVDEVWTMTSTLGFEALIRGKSVTCLGQPFYAGWGLTDDRAPPIPRRQARPDVVALVHAVLIDYPRYFDPVTRQACPVEVVLDRMNENTQIPRSAPNRMLSKLQGILASYAFLWR